MAVAFIGLAIGDASRLAWVCDDAFISYRYAEHLASGMGLVYNAGEAVEGYTNFLWTLLLALGSFLDFSLPEVSIGLGLCCYGLCLMGLGASKSSIDWYALLGGCLIVHFRIFATSGLETMSMLACMVWAIRSIMGSRWELGIALCALSVLIRPEGLALLGVATLLYFQNPRCRKGIYWSWLGVGAYLCWKFWYFGNLLPNTYYAKVEGLRLSEGLMYLWGSMGSLVGIVSVIFVPLVLKAKMSKAQWLCYLVMWIYIVHVIRVGGDFMLGRFALPIIVLGLLLVRPLFQSFDSSPLLKYALWVLVLFLPLGPSSEVLENYGITQERDWYPDHWRVEAKRQGEIMSEFLKDTDIKIVIYGGQAMLGYYSKAPWILEGMTGLTDPELARQPSRHQRVGHGAKATVGYLQARGVDLYVDFRIQQPSHPLNQIQFRDGVKGSILTYQPSKMSVLKERGATFVDFQDYLDAYILTLDTRSSETIQRDYDQFYSYYFKHSSDPIREGAFKERLAPQ